MPPREKPSEASWAATKADSLPQRSPLTTPQESVPPLESAPLTSTIKVQKRKPGRPTKSRLPPTVHEVSLPTSIPTQSDGEGSITKKRKVVLETSDQARNATKEIAITQSTKTGESSPRVDRDPVSQHNDPCLEPIVNDQKMSGLACRVLEREIGSRVNTDQQDGVNHLLSDAKEPSSPKYVSPVFDQILDSEIERPVKFPGQALQTENVQETVEVAQPSKVGFEDEKIDLRPADINLKQRPTREKRKFVGEIQRFVDKDTVVLMSGNLATVTNSETGRLGKTNATLKPAKPRGRPKKILNVIGQGSPAEETLKVEQSGKTKSGVQPSRPPGRLEKAVRRRGRPKKIASIDDEAGDPEGVTHGIMRSEGDLWERRSQIGSPQEKPSTEIEEQPVHDVTGIIRGPTSHDVSGSPGLEGSIIAQTVKPHGDPPLETMKQPQKESISPAEAIHSLDKSSNAHLHDGGTGMHPPKNLQPKTQAHSSKKPRLRGETDGPLGASHSSRILGSEFDMHVVDPCENLSSGTQGQSSQVPTIQGQASYSPSNFYSALQGNTESVNPVKKASSKIRKQAQRIPQNQNVTNQNETAPKKRLALLQRQSTKNPSHEQGDYDRSFAPASERIEKEGVSQGLEVYKDELSFQPPQITTSKNQHGPSEDHPKRQRPAPNKGKTKDVEAPPLDGVGPQPQVPLKRRGRPKKEAVPNVELTSKTMKAKEGSNAESRYASFKPSSNLVPISVYRLSCDKGESATAAPNSAACINDKCISAADVLAHICHEFALTSHALANYSVQNPSRIPSKAELKRKLEINEDGRGTLDGPLFQLVSMS